MLFLSNPRLMTVTTAMVKPDWLISITDPGTVVPSPAGVSAERHRTLRFHDLTQPVDGPGIILPDRMAASSVFDMLLDIPADQFVLIHCLAGYPGHLPSCWLLCIVAGPMPFGRRPPPLWTPLPGFPLTDSWHNRWTKSWGGSASPRLSRKWENLG